MNKGTAYDKANEILNRDTSHFFQKLNYFLVATGFLIAAFATILTIGKYSTWVYFDYFICSAGLIYSLLYAIIMSHNARILFLIGEYIIKLELTDFATPVGWWNGTSYKN